jgi:hypothetical protein
MFDQLAKIPSVRSLFQFIISPVLFLKNQISPQIPRYMKSYYYYITWNCIFVPISVVVSGNDMLANDEWVAGTLNSVSKAEQAKEMAELGLYDEDTAVPRKLKTMGENWADEASNVFFAAGAAANAADEAKDMAQQAVLDTERWSDAREAKAELIARTAKARVAQLMPIHEQLASPSPHHHHHRHVPWLRDLPKEDPVTGQPHNRCAVVTLLGQASCRDPFQYAAAALTFMHTLQLTNTTVHGCAYLPDSIQALIRCFC